MPHQVASVGRLLLAVPQTDVLSPTLQLLQQDGHVVQVCAGHDTLSVALAEQPDVIILDTPFPGAVGLPVLTELQAHPGTRNIPVVFLTVAHDLQRLLHAFEYGAVCCVRKPYDGNELRAQVRVHVTLKLTRDRLLKVAHEREVLFNLVAHDLKNPLASVLFAGEMLAMPDCKPERVPRYLQIIDDSAREALGCIRNYLQSQSNSSCPAPESAHACAHLGDTVRWLAARYELQLEASGVRMHIHIPDTAACVAFSGQQLRQVGENLISNALKYAREGGELELLVRAGSQGRWQLVAQDRGPGVAVDFQATLFTPFLRPGGQTTITEQSSGLGLALSRQLVVNAGGRLWYEDREDRGARFVVELPAADCSHCFG